ncbi:hypothetical protein OCGS_2077 [Oceaniovalibus guishaninsula JLT2003]|uniref:Zinc finger/thioredoxin putative domain-containing protein n=1 Tax=Oceaniovalibus guishaninsula JLT2003 TaxID=1231392 RepID=K2H7Z3_9RHOB|nr:zinc-ribbon domain-containing protein [Oceaniovalibus guishaninsula]EKE43743.1 hypothetical protein OCGS_2077 [Oceaniovalibus guishaninsula JLT2003]
MRLTCPNCRAEYEVDEAVIPPAGRDVECSACDHTWFQRPVAASSPEPDLPQRELDPRTRTILREEAEREAAARRRRRAAMAAMAAGETRGAPKSQDASPPAPAAPPPPSAAEGALPDADAIGSTLTPRETEKGDAPSGRRGFWLGFVAVLLIALVLGAVYLFVADLSRAIPAAEPTLSAYADRIDALRLTLDGWLRGVTSGTN